MSNVVSTVCVSRELNKNLDDNGIIFFSRPFDGMNERVNLSISVKITNIIFAVIFFIFFLEMGEKEEKEKLTILQRMKSVFSVNDAKTLTNYGNNPFRVLTFHL